MPMRMLMTFAAACVAGCLNSAAAQDDHSQADEDACRPDVFRLCASEIPDESAIVTCLDREALRLSPACHAVIVPDRQMSRSRPRRVR